MWREGGSQAVKYSWHRGRGQSCSYYAVPTHVPTGADEGEQEHIGSDVAEDERDDEAGPPPEEAEEVSERNVWRYACRMPRRTSTASRLDHHRVRGISDRKCVGRVADDAAGPPPEELTADADGYSAHPPVA